MSIPFETTRITVRGVRPVRDYDPDTSGYDEVDPPVKEEVASGVRASITQPKGQRDREEETDRWAFRCDVVDINRFDEIEDDDGDIYEVVWVERSKYTGFGLDHMIGEVKRMKGYAGGQ
jgi:hypothetical protein